MKRPKLPLQKIFDDDMWQKRVMAWLAGNTSSQALWPTLVDKQWHLGKEGARSRICSKNYFYRLANFILKWNHKSLSLKSQKQQEVGKKRKLKNGFSSNRSLEYFKGPHGLIGWNEHRDNVESQISGIWCIPQELLHSFHGDLPKRKQHNS